MTTRICRNGLMVALLASAACVATAAAQEQSGAREAAQPAAAGQAPAAAQPPASASQSSPASAGASAHTQRQSGVSDRDIASLLIIDNAGEVALNQFASQRTQNDRVKQFAEQMVRDHSQFIEQLQQVSLGAGQARSASATAGQAAAGQPAGAADATAGQHATAAGQAAMAGPYHGMMAIQADAGRRKVQLSQQMLSEFQGAEFDMAFMGEQLVLHNHMLALLQAVEQHASPELRQVVTKGIQASEQHLGHARQLIEHLDGQQTRTARAGGRAGTTATDSHPESATEGTRSDSGDSSTGANRPAGGRSDSDSARGSGSSSGSRTAGGAGASGDAAGSGSNSGRTSGSGTSGR